MFSFSIELKELKALMLFAGLSDVREYLNTLYVSVSRGKVILCACTSSKAGWLKLQTAQGQLEQTRSFIIPRNVIDELKGAAKTLIRFDCGAESAKITKEGVTLEASYLTGYRYPDMNRVLPSRETLKLVAKSEEGLPVISPHDMIVLETAAQAFSGKSKKREQALLHGANLYAVTDTGLGMLSADGRFFGYVMAFKRNCLFTEAEFDRNSFLVGV